MPGSAAWSVGNTTLVWNWASPRLVFLISPGFKAEALQEIEQRKTCRKSKINPRDAQLHSSLEFLSELVEEGCSDSDGFCFCWHAILVIRDGQEGGGVRQNEHGATADECAKGWMYMKKSNERRVAYAPFLCEASLGPLPCLSVPRNVDRLRAPGRLDQPSTRLPFLVYATRWRRVLCWCRVWVFPPSLTPWNVQAWALSQRQ
ncbi:hypothetical protein LY78DRAFT_19563 [Colletotrichum sublineola]|nr:hypothetical protein LY78DRAFT_19563 [Colletotrichum sublineola]